MRKIDILSGIASQIEGQCLGAWSDELPADLAERARRNGVVIAYVRRNGVVAVQGAIDSTTQDLDVGRSSWVLNDPEWPARGPSLEDVIAEAGEATGGLDEPTSQRRTVRIEHAPGVELGVECWPSARPARHRHGDKSTQAAGPSSDAPPPPLAYALSCDLPHATFVLNVGDEPFSLGLVMSLDDVLARHVNSELEKARSHWRVEADREQAGPLNVVDADGEALMTVPETTTAQQVMLCEHAWRQGRIEGKRVGRIEMQSDLRALLGL